MTVHISWVEHLSLCTDDFFLLMIVALFVLVGLFFFQPLRYFFFRSSSMQKIGRMCDFSMELSTTSVKSITIDEGPITS